MNAEDPAKAAGATEERELPTSAVDALGSSPDTGLASAVAAIRLRRDGPNDVPERKSHPVLRFLGKFWGLSAWMVELIAALSFILRKETDFIIALALLVVPLPA